MNKRFIGFLSWLHLFVAFIGIFLLEAETLLWRRVGFSILALAAGVGLVRWLFSRAQP